MNNSLPMGMNGESLQFRRTYFELKTQKLRYRLSEQSLDPDSNITYGNGVWDDDN